ncbi:MAG: hypothetical protein IBJ03_15720 [Gemmatimonadaceae bacterium]|nr:hypothetical protein [Gemmatimonadaceae bacterium]
MNASGWSVLATYPSGFEADLAIAQLEAAEIPAVRDNNDSVGIFGPGYQGATAKGVTVHVPTEALDEAREAVSILESDLESED